MWGNNKYYKLIHYSAIMGNSSNSGKTFFKGSHGSTQTGVYIAVLPILVDDIKISSTSDTLVIGESAQLHVTISPNDASNKKFSCFFRQYHFISFLVKSNGMWGNNKYYKLIHYSAIMGNSSNSGKTFFKGSNFTCC
jgi:hypothetical protein